MYGEEKTLDGILEDRDGCGMRRIKLVKIGDYVLLSRWPTPDPNNPWTVGNIVEHGMDLRGRFYRVGNVHRVFRYVHRVTLKEGKRICREWPGLETTKLPELRTA